MWWANRIELRVPFLEVNQKASLAHFHFIETVTRQSRPGLRVLSFGSAAHIPFSHWLLKWDHSRRLITPGYASFLRGLTLLQIFPANYISHLLHACPRHVLLSAFLPCTACFDYRLSSPLSGEIVKRGDWPQSERERDGEERWTEERGGAWYDALLVRRIRR